MKPPKKKLSHDEMVEHSLKQAANRLFRLFELGAPDIIKFNEFKFLESRFQEWCSDKGMDPKRDWMDHHIAKEKMN